jgi:hypothetical protein
MTDYKRTRIAKLSVQRYRSIAELHLDDLPAVVVLHGPNGAGKSNILRALQLLLRAASAPGELPRQREAGWQYSLADADKRLGLRPDDFRFGDVPEIRVSAHIDLGDRAHAVLLASAAAAPTGIELEGVFQLTGQGIRVWFERANASGMELGAVPNNPARVQIQNLATMRATLAQKEASRAQVESELSATSGAQEAGARANLQQSTADISYLRTQVAAQEAALGQAALVAERIGSLLLPSLIQASPTYRTPDGPDTPLAALYRSFLSENSAEREAAARLGARLAKARLFGVSTDTIPLLPVVSRTYAEQQVRFRHPTHGELSLRNLGSGEQQVVLLLAQRVFTPHPIAHMEEPEAHLHKDLMEPFARVLRDSVDGNGNPPDVDQLWIATHHRYFAIAERYLDVSLDQRGATRVSWKPRDESAVHFYEPSPYWETLRGLVESGMDPETVVSQDVEGQPVHAKDILASIQGDRKLADRFVEAATRAFVLSLGAKDEGK